MRSLSFKVLLLPAMSLCFTLQRGLDHARAGRAPCSHLRRNLMPDMRRGSFGTRMAAFLPVNPATTKRREVSMADFALTAFLTGIGALTPMSMDIVEPQKMQAAKATARYANSCSKCERTDLEALAATLGLRGITMLNLLLRLTRTLPAAFFFLGGAAFILRGALLRLKSPMKGLDDLVLGLAARVAPVVAGFAAAAGAAGAGGVPALGPRAANVRVAMARAKGSERVAGAAAIKARKACILSIPP